MNCRLAAEKSDDRSAEDCALAGYGNTIFFKGPIFEATGGLGRAEKSDDRSAED